MQHGAVITERYKENRHHIGAALRTRLRARLQPRCTLITYVGSRLGLRRGDRRRPGDELPAMRTSNASSRSGIPGRAKNLSRNPESSRPCGICREMLADFAPNCAVIVPSEQGIARVPVAALLPNKYQRKT